MIGLPRSLLVLSLLAMACTSQAPEPWILLDLEVPAELARRAAARTAGDAAAPSPILLVEDVEIGTGERIVLEVVDPEADGEAPTLGQAATVGTEDGAYAEPVQLHTLVIPLNDAGCSLLAGKERVRLALKVESVGDRPPLRFGRIRFASDGND